MRGRSGRTDRDGLVGTYGLLALGIVLVGVFTVLLPDTFATGGNLRGVLANNAIPAILALGAMIPIVTGRFDLSIGYNLGLCHVLAIYLLVVRGLPWPVTVVAVLLCGLLVGLVNGLLVEFAQIDSFIATLGTGSVLYAVVGWLTDGARIVPTAGHALPAAFTNLVDSRVLGLPVAFSYVVVLGIALWLALERLPVGRYLYVIGANPRAAELVGIPKRRYVVLTFVGSGTVTAFAGVLLAAQQRIGNPSVGLEYLLPAFVGALLGSTTIRPGRANAFGTVVSVAVLAIGLSGITQLGAQFWVTPLFNGLTLLAAVGLAGWSARRRQLVGAAATTAALAASPPGTRPPDDDAGGVPAAAADVRHISPA